MMTLQPRTVSQKQMVTIFESKTLQNNKVYSFSNIFVLIQVCLTEIATEPKIMSQS